jgi:hypothetical protein
MTHTTTRQPRRLFDAFGKFREEAKRRREIEDNVLDTARLRAIGL